MAALKNHENAEIDIRKLKEYALNADHPTGSHKARRIKSALGFDADHVGELVTQIRRSLPSTDAIAGHSDHHGQRYTVDMKLTGPRGAAVVRTGWMIDNDGETPRLITIYVRGP